jgi:hypothetical protein
MPLGHPINLLHPRPRLRRNPRLIRLDLRQLHGQFVALSPQRPERLQ